jgi:hypothetical protein
VDSEVREREGERGGGRKLNERKEEREVWSARERVRKEKDKSKL